MGYIGIYRKKPKICQKRPHFDQNCHIIPPQTRGVWQYLNNTLLAKHLQKRGFLPKGGGSSIKRWPETIFPKICKLLVKTRTILVNNLCKFGVLTKIYLYRPPKNDHFLAFWPTFYWENSLFLDPQKCHILTYLLYLYNILYNTI
jgi:hypothetical protein